MAKLKDDIIEIIKNRCVHLYQLKELTRYQHSNDAIDYIVENEIELVDGKYLIKDAKRIEREDDYNPRHMPNKDKMRSDNFMVSEKWLVKNMFLGNIQQSAFGKLVEYEIPLNAKQDDGTGDIDFMSIKNGRLWLVEIKNYTSGEGILKAILEVQSYYQIVNREKMLADFNLPLDTEIKKVVVVFDDTTASRQIKNKKKMQELLKMLEVKVLILERPEKIGFDRIKVKSEIN